MNAHIWRRPFAGGLGLALVLLAGAPAHADDCVPPMKDCAPAPPGLEGMVPDLDILKTPASPALAQVGGAPVDIERPTTPQGAAASLGTGILHGLFVPGTTAAVEVLPYWLMDHPLLNADDVESTRRWSIVRDLAISFATSPGADPAKPASMTTDGTTSTTTTTGTTTADAGLMALGVRTTLWPGEPSKAALRCMSRIDDFMKGDVALRNADEMAFKAKWEQQNPKPTVKRIDLPKGADESWEDWSKRMKAANDEAAEKSYDDAINARANAYLAAVRQWEVTWEAAHGVPADVTTCTSVVGHRVGIVASIAGSGFVSAPQGDFTRYHQGGTWGMTGWLTGGYSWLTETDSAWSFSLLGALRLRHLRVVDTTAHTNATDYGARVVVANGRWGASVQAMRLGDGSNGLGSSSAWQGGLAVDYHLKSGYWLTVTAGSTALSEIDSWSAATALVHLQYVVVRDRRIQTDTTTVVASGSQQ